MTSVPRAASPCCWWSDALPCVRAPDVFRACANGRRRVVSASRSGAPREGPRLRTTARAGPGPAVLLIARLASVSQGNPRGAPSVRGLRRPGDGPRSPRASTRGAGTSARSDERRATMSSPSLSAHGAAAFMESGEVTPWGAEVRGTRCGHSGACPALTDVQRRLYRQLLALRRLPQGVRGRERRLGLPRGTSRACRKADSKARSYVRRGSARRSDT
jgi:hypothetical protein